MFIGFWGVGAYSGSGNGPEGFLERERHGRWIRAGTEEQGPTGVTERPFNRQEEEVEVVLA